MTYKRLKNLTQLLLSGDTVLPVDDDEELLPLLEYALEMVAYAAETQVLRSTDNTQEFIRDSYKDAGEFIRRAKLPVSNEDIIDIDEGLIFAVARKMAAFVSQEKFNYHDSVGDAIIAKFNESIVALENRGM